MRDPLAARWLPRPRTPLPRPRGSARLPSRPYSFWRVLMKKVFLRSGLTLLCAATLASCGGGSGSMVLLVTITGLTQPGLVLMNGGDTVPVAANISQQSFPTLVANDQQFDITFTNPANAKCTLTKGKNKANVYTVQQPVLA